MTDALSRLTSALSDRYTIERELGAGGMATVYLAEDLKHERQVAVKVLRPELAAALGAERFHQEIKIAANLHHPHILPLYDSGEAGGFLYYVMPYEEGQSLRDKLAKEGELPIAEAVRILRDVVDALSDAHEHGVVHRDIKPDNVLLTKHHALVTDFGVAKAVSEATGRQQLTTEGVALGTPTYMAPEQAAADPHIDHRADIYAVGAVAYELLTGRPPFLGTTQQELLAAHVMQTPDPVTKYRESVPPALAELVMKCLEKKAADRWQTAEELLQELELLTTPPAGVTAPLRSSDELRRRSRRWGYAAVSIAALIAVVLVGQRSLDRRHEVAGVLNEGIPEIRRLRDSGDLNAAFARALQAKAILGDRPVLDTVLTTFTDTGTIRSEPSGASAWWRPFGGSEEQEIYLGVTPAVTLVPRTYFDVRLERSGYESRTAASQYRRFVGTYTAYFGGPIHLAPEGSVPEGMVYIPGGEFHLASSGLEGVEPVSLGPYYLDRTEATNRDYKVFVDSGGYRNATWWVHPFVDGNDTLAWEQAVARFTDRTGRRGPSTWEAGDYAEGADEFPVSGVSWFEAAAYAEFRGKDLPTIFHWNRALDAPNAAFIAPRSVFGSDGPQLVGASGARGRYGNYDMGGNVREWCFNESGGRRFILGGGWNDAPFMLNDAYTQSPWERSATNSFRLATYGNNEPNLAIAARGIDRLFRDFRSLTPVSDEIYEVYRSIYAYDHTPLNARREAVDTTRDWIRERVSFDAGYEGERAFLYLYLPRSGSRPYQPVIYYPGSTALILDSMDDDFKEFWEFVVKTGRALVYPVYWGTFERRAGLTTVEPDTTTAYRDRVVRWSKDFRRSLDWAETRADLDMDHLGFYGFSWGGRLGPLMLALEPRVQAAVLNVGGLKFQPSMPEVDTFNHASRVRIPVLMLNGELDHFYPLETSAKPLFELLGTPDSLKRHVIEVGGHLLRQDRVISEALVWFDRFLGPVR